MAIKNTTSSSPIQKLARIVTVALSLVLTVGVAAAVAGKAGDESVIRTRPERANRTVPMLMASAKTVEITSPITVQAAGSAPASTELMHDATIEPTPVPVAHHRRLVLMEVTAYCACPKCCGVNAAGITASGKLVNYNGGRFVAADPSLAFGTKLVIPGYDAGPVEVIDRGGAIRGNKIDVFYPTHEQALEWGRRSVQVTILD